MEIVQQYLLVLALLTHALTFRTLESASRQYILTLRTLALTLSTLTCSFWNSFWNKNARVISQSVTAPYIQSRVCIRKLTL